MIDAIRKYSPQTKMEESFDFFDFIVTAFIEYEKGSYRSEAVSSFERCIDNMNVYYDHIVFEHNIASCTRSCL